jgi:hypothetical protein
MYCLWNRFQRVNDLKRGLIEHLATQHCNIVCKDSYAIEAPSRISAFSHKNNGQRRYKCIVYGTVSKEIIVFEYTRLCLCVLVIQRSIDL